MHVGDVVEPRLAAVRDDHPGRSVATARDTGEVPGDRDARPAGPEAQQLAARALPVSGGHEGVQCEAARDGVLRVADEQLALLGEAARLAHRQRVWVDDVEEVPGCGIEVDLVGSDECAETQLVVANELDHLPVQGRVGVQRQVEPDELGITELEVFGPEWEDAPDPGRAGRHTDEVDGSAHRGWQLDVERVDLVRGGHGVTPSIS